MLTCWQKDTSLNLLSISCCFVVTLRQHNEWTVTLNRTFLFSPAWWLECLVCMLVPQCWLLEFPWTFEEYSSFILSPSLADLGRPPELLLALRSCILLLASSSIFSSAIFGSSCNIWALSKLLAFARRRSLPWLSMLTSGQGEATLCSSFVTLICFSESDIPSLLWNLSTKSSISVGGACLCDTITLPMYHKGKITAKFSLDVSACESKLLLFIGDDESSTPFSFAVRVLWSTPCLAASRMPCRKPFTCN